jgi:hypothetical protein
MSLATERHRPEPRQLPADLIDAPKAVTKALAEAVEAGNGLTEARAQQSAAKAAIAQADEADRAADSAAVAAGKPLPGAKAGQKAREAVEVADRRLLAAETNYSAATDRLMAAVTDDASDWLDVLRKQRERTESELDDSLAAFARSRAMLKAIDGTISMAAEFEEGGFDARLDGFPTTAQIERGAAEPDRIRAEVLSAVRGSRRFRVNESDVHRVVVELGLIARGERPWSESLHGSKEKEGPGSEGERVAAVFGGVS